jgi:hypothetical protein
MVITDSSSAVAARFFAPALDLIPACGHQRFCHELSDAQWLRVGVHRCLMPQPSGRGFLQTLGSLDPELCPGNSHFFESLKSERRLKLCAELNALLCELGRARLPDALAAFKALDGFDVHAADGHFHAHAAHDPADADGKKHAMGHLFMRNLRTGMMSHLTACDQVARKKEHDVRALKRTSPKALRQGASKGRKVLLAYDRAIIDFRLLHEWKQGSGIYVVTRCKENLALIKCGHLPFDRADAINAGVMDDELVGTGTAGLLMRRITFHDVLGGRTFEFLTNLNDSSVPPGLLAFVYRMRWDIEKSFDEFKNKLGEKKAWATSATAKSMQAQFMCLSANLLHLLEHELAAREGITNIAEEARRAKRLVKAKAVAKDKNMVLPAALCSVQKLTQHTLKLIRWVGVQLWLDIPWKQACAALVALYANL